ncbi:MAG: S16 family serine protease [Acidimicrobiia bacterium]
MVPRRNEIDLDDVPEKVRDEMTFHIADDVSDVLGAALVEV